MIQRLISRFRQRQAGRDSGAVAVELAIVAPLLVVLVLGVADYGILMDSSAALFAGTRSGAEVAKANQNATAAQLTALNIFPTGATPKISAPFCTCVDNTSVTCPGPGAANPCAAKTDPRVLKYVTVSATNRFSPLLAWPSFTFPSSLNANAVPRLQ